MKPEDLNTKDLRLEFRKVHNKNTTLVEHKDEYLLWLEHELTKERIRISNLSISTVFSQSKKFIEFEKWLDENPIMKELDLSFALNRFKLNKTSIE